MYDTERSLTALQANSFGHANEKLVKMACDYYNEQGIAYIMKIPEPFRVQKKDRKRHTADIHFTGNADPDFCGTFFYNNRAYPIMFEAKATMTDKINLDVISEHQRKALDTFYKLKSIAAVEVRIKEEFFFVPWKIWKNGQEIFGRKYLKAEDIKEYRVPIGGDGVLFLEGILQRERAKK